MLLAKKVVHIDQNHSGRTGFYKKNLVRAAWSDRKDLSAFRFSLQDMVNSRNRGSPLSHPKIEKIVKPIASSSYLSRGQIDLIDFSTISPEDNAPYKWLLEYIKTILQSLSYLRALVNKCAEEVANALMDFFCDLGAPLILQSDNGREFKNSLLLNILNENWPSTKIIHGKPRHPETQGSVERANQDIKRHFTAMMFENSDNYWVKYVRQVQYKKNTNFHSTIGMTPFQALVHRKPPQGLIELGIPIEAIDNIWSEEDIERVTEEMNNPSTPLRPEEYDNLREVHYYEGQDSVIPLSDIYMEEISLPPSSNLRHFRRKHSPRESRNFEVPTNE